MPCHGPQAGACLCGRVSASAALVSRGARAFHEPSVAGSGLPTAPGPFRERQAVCRTFEAGILSPVRIAAGSLKGPGRASAFPALQLGRCLARCEGKVFNFGLALGATGRQAGIFPVAGAVCPPQSSRPCIGRSAARRSSPCGRLPRRRLSLTARPTRSRPPSAGRTMAGKPTSACVQHDPKITQAERPRPSHNVLLPPGRRPRPHNQPARKHPTRQAVQTDRGTGGFYRRGARRRSQLLKPRSRLLKPRRRSFQQRLFDRLNGGSMEPCFASPTRDANGCATVTRIDFSLI